MSARGRALLVALAVLALGLAARLSGLGAALGGRAEVVPFDDLYHAKRIVHSAEQFPGVLDFDPARGARGAFCPWPPLYDLSAAAVARACGARTPSDVLGVVRFLPPLAASLFAAAVALGIALRAGAAAGAVAGLALAFSVPYLAVSRFGALDHHFLEPPLALASALATARLLEASGRRVLLPALALGAALAAGILVQPAHLVSAALAAAALLLLAGGRRDALAGGALAFLLALAPAALFRATRAPGYPGSPWFLGAPHLAALGAAALALGLASLLEARGTPRLFGRAVAILSGAALVLVWPGAAGPVLASSRFFGGDPWLDQIVEFQPLLRAMDPWSALCFLGGSALLLPFAALSSWRRGDGGRVLLLFGAAYTVVALQRLRFAPLSVAFAAPLGALLLGEMAVRGRRAPALAAGALILLPSLSAALPAAIAPEPIVAEFARPAVRAAQRLRSEPPGRLLGPWSFGHVFDVIGGHAVVLDNFGSWIGAADFERAVGTLLTTREERLAAACRAGRIRYLALVNPLGGLPQMAESISLAPSFFVRPGPEGPRVTRFLQATIWWRAYYDGGQARPERGRWGEPLRQFEVIYRDPDPSPEPAPYRGPALVLLRLRGPLESDP